MFRWPPRRLPREGRSRFTCEFQRTVGFCRFSPTRSRGRRSRRGRVRRRRTAPAATKRTDPFRAGASLGSALTSGAVILITTHLGPPGDPDAVVGRFIRALRDHDPGRAVCEVADGPLTPPGIERLLARNPHIFNSQDWTVSGVEWESATLGTFGSALVSVKGLDGRTHELGVALRAERDDVWGIVGKWRVATLTSAALSPAPPPLAVAKTRVWRDAKSGNWDRVRGTFTIGGLDAAWTGKGWRREFQITASLGGSQPLSLNLEPSGRRSFSDPTRVDSPVPCEVILEVPVGSTDGNLEFQVEDFAGGRRYSWSVPIPPDRQILVHDCCRGALPPASRARCSPGALSSSHKVFRDDLQLQFSEPWSSARKRAVD